jgi:demethylmenaquinone methyltransferase/2-methoxy-6-polyprenyl-1,4-benzoquinol methylase
MRKGVQKIFSEVADTYELVNHVLTFGLDILWRKKAARLGARAGGRLWLDVCSGTGEMATNLSRLAGEKTKVISVDFCYPMVAKALEKKKNSNPSFVVADAGHLPFPDATFDLVTISFATRNIAPNREILSAHLREFLRVIKPGKYFLNLETSQPSSKIMRRLFHLYVRILVKPLGFFLSGSKAGYRYLAFTIPRFFSAEEFSSVLYGAGFSAVSYGPLFSGVASIHIAQK